ncbi:MAG: S8 family serine peptidase, partial [Candidatus Thorarchaeota archaeon]
PEIGADDVWKMVDGLGQNLTGEGLLIADLDSGVDWRHPDLWFADGGEYDWLDEFSPTGPTNGSDAIDLDDNGAPTSNEILRWIDIDLDGTLNASTDWIWNDAIGNDSVIQASEPFFVVNDTNSNDALDLGEKLIRLSTPKTRYIVEMDGNPLDPQQLVWERGVNLTSSTHNDTDGHGTAVAGILLGGQLGYREYVGVAPDAELMMIKVFGQDYTYLSLDEGLFYAWQNGADIILIEVGKWWEEFLDGSSVLEGLIDTIVQDGIPVIAPSGNLGGKDKHAKASVPAPSPGHIMSFSVPWSPSEIQRVKITILTVNDTDFMNANFTVGVPAGAAPPLSYTLLHPNYGHRNWGMDFDPGTGVNFQSYILNSSRGTKMMYIEMWKSGGLPNSPPWPFYELNITLADSANVQCYIADDQTSWTGGAVWVTDMSNDYLIVHPSTADSALSVASYHTRNLFVAAVGDIASYSAIGPRIDGVAKQGVAAPGGLDIISDYSNDSFWDSSWFAGPSQELPLNPMFGGYRLFSGTSAAGPHVAGGAALMLQLDSTRGTEVAQIIKSTAASDGLTGAVPNPTWGAGKLNVTAAVLYMMTDTSGPSIGSPTRDPTAPTPNDDVEISVGVNDQTGVDTVILEYYNGTHWNNITMVWNGTHYVGDIPALPEGTSVTYRIHANDTLGFWSTSADYSYTSQTGGTTTTTTTTTTTGTTTPTIPEFPDYLMLALMLGAILVLIVIGVAVSRRRGK